MLKHFRVPGRLALKLEELGISVPVVLRRAGLPRDLFDQTRILVSTSELFALWRAVEAVSSDPLVGLRLGVETKTERFHPMGIAALSTQNLVAAAEHMARYKKLTAPEEILTLLDEQEFSIGFRWLLAVDAEPQVLTDYCFAWMLSIARHGTGTQLSPVRVEYVQQRVNLRAIEQNFGCKVIGGASRNAIIFRATDATAPFVTRNAELLDLLAPQFEEQLRQYKAEDSFIELVHRAIQDRLTGQRPSIDAISQGLHMSPRTLQRRLQESGSSFQRVLDEARHQMARYYLSNSVLELNEAAYLLGFEDPNSFGRAFRAWEGVPPSDWRETHRTSTDSLQQADLRHPIFGRNTQCHSRARRSVVILKQTRQNWRSRVST
jgi:AraC-like DNA-binding protein